MQNTAEYVKKVIYFLSFILSTELEPAWINTEATL